MRKQLQKEQNERLKFVASTMFFGALLLAITGNFLWIRFYSPEMQPISSSTAIISQQFIKVLQKYSDKADVSHAELEKDLKYMRSESTNLKVNLTLVDHKRKECENNHKICLDNLAKCEQQIISG